MLSPGERPNEGAAIGGIGGGPLAAVLVGVDDSTSSYRAVEWVAQLAAVTGSSVIAAHVLTFNEEFVRDGLTVDTMRTWRRDLDVELRDKWLRPLVQAGIAHSHRVVEAESVDAGLLSCAADATIDLIVVGASGSGGIIARLLDGATSRLTHRASQPVVVVPRTWNPAAVPADEPRPTG
ncbi:universal stress protein [Aquihabitans daechungensis]|uniref:universal stress protein n=1 Tax=Aquihabitans daechungensis TaxID=1052257 RepID=UPI003BA0DA43